MNIGMTKNLACTFEEAMQKVPEALKTEGFGVLTSIDVKDTLKQKLGVDFRRYTILGACNPPLAHRALSTHLGFGLLMPCNVVVYEETDGKATVQAVDPMQTIAPKVSREMEAFAEEIRSKLVRVLERL